MESGSSTSAFVADSDEIDFNLELPPGILETGNNQATDHVNRSRMGHDRSVSEAHCLVTSPGHPNHDQMGQPQGEPFTGTSHFSHNQMMQARDEGPATMPGHLSHDQIGWQP